MNTTQKIFLVLGCVTIPIVVWFFFMSNKDIPESNMLEYIEDAHVVETIPVGDASPDLIDKYNRFLEGAGKEKLMNE